MAKEVVVTREGYQKLEQDLNELRTVKRKEVADKIKVARGYGDLSENAEYDAAKEEQAIVEARIADLRLPSSTTASCPTIPFPSVCASDPRRGGIPRTPKNTTSPALPRLT